MLSQKPAICNLFVSTVTSYEFVVKCRINATVDRLKAVSEKPFRASKNELETAVSLSVSSRPGGSMLHENTPRPPGNTFYKLSTFHFSPPEQASLDTNYIITITTVEEYK